MAPVPRRRLPSAVVRGRDYSCYARIENRTTRPLRLVRSAKPVASFWAVPPPKEIRPHSRADIWVQDTPGTTVGSAGGFSYSDGTRTYDFAVSCPVALSNSVSSPVPYETKVGNGSWRTGTVDSSGYPVQARFYVGAALPLGTPCASHRRGRRALRAPGPPVGRIDTSSRRDRSSTGRRHRKSAGSSCASRT